MKDQADGIKRMREWLEEIEASPSGDIEAPDEIFESIKRGLQEAIAIAYSKGDESQVFEVHALPSDPLLQNQDQNIRAVCTWGDGPDVLLMLEGKPLVLYEDPSRHDRYTHGIVTKGSLDLSLPEAKALVSDLMLAIQAVEQIEAQLDYDMATWQRLDLTTEEAAVVQDLIDNPPEANAALKRAMKRHHELLNCGSCTQRTDMCSIGECQKK